MRDLQTTIRNAVKSDWENVMGIKCSSIWIIEINRLSASSLLSVPPLNWRSFQSGWLWMGARLRLPSSHRYKALPVS